MAAARLVAAFGRLSLSASRPPSVRPIAAKGAAFLSGKPLSLAAVRPKFVQVAVFDTDVVCGKLKMKTRQSVRKRFKATGSGKILRRKQGKQHLNEKKKRKRIVGLTKMGLVHKTDRQNIYACCPKLRK
eukprot:evm.model.scf_418.3 EVM.evm.TU.scf_418.3   scf_418:22978-24446(+)